MQGKHRFSTVVHLQVSQTSAAAREAVEKAGGSVTTVYYNKLGAGPPLCPLHGSPYAQYIYPGPSLCQASHQVG